MPAPSGDAAAGAPRALVTRPSADDPLCRALAAAGFDVVPAALTETRPAPLATRRLALDAVRDAAWLAVTSPTAVRVLRDTTAEAGTTLAAALGVAAARPGRPALRVAAVGRGTARALEAAGVPVDLTPPPDAENAAGLANAFPDAPPRGFPAGGIAARGAGPLRPPVRPDAAAPARGAAERVVVSDDPAPHRVADAARHVVLPASMLASPTLARGLRARGWEVSTVPIYTTATVSGANAEAARALVGNWPEVVVLTAGSGVRALVEMLGVPPAGTAVAVIGEPTARACAEAGIRVDAIAVTPDPADLAAAAVAALAAVRS